ncbi:hypothetical protein CC86DRAFT_356812 [Ophiobolus disseminans]|uniref:Zn(2)-C6 fungal-type domain-containing protein n=1 Tax=Ophiobolus disseminans TaxID=1469910 RepID=A0A6A6ZPE0_9PLEO|nr:hypothetical protein CC86DRAFT_356812 [Ophiobolus disseminans]
MKKSENGENKATRQCWECLKRRLVCDHTLPHCKKCQKTGKDCPGYDEQKPLQWVQPGKVTSRRRKKDSPPKIYTAPSSQVTKCKPREPILDSGLRSALCTITKPEDPIFDPEEWQAFFFASELPTEGDFAEIFEESPGEVPKAPASFDLSRVGEVDQIFASGGRERIEEVLEKGLVEQAVQMMGPKKNPLKRLERILRLMQINDLPNYSYLTNETNEIVQAVNYYNVRIQPAAIVCGELAPNPAIIQFPLNALHVLPPAIHHTIVCLAVNHFIHTLPVGADKSTIVMNRSKVYQHRGAAIRFLSQYVAKDKTRCSDMSIASIMMFMSMELQNPAMADWRSHASGMKQLVDMRGGLRTLLKESPHLSPTLVVYILIITIANTCSPSWDQLSLSGTPASNVADITAVYDLIFPYTLCPTTLFISILHTNHLRNAAAAVLFTGDFDPNHTMQAHDILASIEAFSPADWAQPGPHFAEWLLVGNIYQSAIALYCTMALQSLTILPNTLEMNAMRSVHGDQLMQSLRQALQSPRLQGFMIWPLVVAGVEAGYRDEATRYWVGREFGNLSRALGTSSPLKAEAVLRRYWQKEERGWDECFDRPYVFVI